MNPETASTPFTDPARQGDAGRLGMWVFLATEVLFFGPLFSGYLYGRVHFAASFAAASRHTDVFLGTANTAVLLTSSCAMALAVAARREGALRAARWLLAATAALGGIFLVLKGLEYYKDWSEHLVPGAAFAFETAFAGGAEVFFYLYFLMTGLHALHLAIGIGAVACMALSLRRGGSGMASVEHVEITGLYWHFVDIVWIFLYPMLYLVGRGAGA